MSSLSHVHVEVAIKDEFAAARAATKLWFSDVCEQYELEAHHVLLLTIACDAWDNHSAILLS